MALSRIVYNHDFGACSELIPHRRSNGFDSRRFATDEPGVTTGIMEANVLIQNRKSATQ